MINVLKNVLHQLQKINYHTDDLYLYQPNNLVTKALLQIQIGRLMEYVEQQIKENELEQDNRGSPSE
jgi:hypothetical protein